MLYITRITATYICITKDRSLTEINQKRKRDPDSKRNKKSYVKPTAKNN